MTKKRLIALLAAAAMLASSSAALAAEKDAPETAAAVVTEAVTEEAVPQAQEIPEAPAELADDDVNVTPSSAVASVGDMTYATLQEAVNAAVQASDEDTSVEVLLSDDITLAEENSLKIYSDYVSIILNLNGHTITSSTQKGNDAISLNGANITLEIKDGVIDSTGVDSYGLYAYQKCNNLNLTFNNVEIRATGYALGVQGLTSNSNVVLKNSKIKCDGLGIYWPPKSGNLIIDDTEVTGGTGVVVKGAFVEVKGNSVITGTGEKKEAEDYYTGATDPNESSLTETGDAIYLESGYNDRDIGINIFGGILKSDNSYSLQTFIKTGEEEKSSRKIDISGGVFESGIVIQPYGKLTITGGTFSTDVSGYVASGYYFDTIDSTVKKSETNVNNKATAVTTTIELNDLEKTLEKTDGYSKSDSDIYDVNVKAPTGKDKEAVEKLAAEAKADGKRYEAYDITVTKNGKEVEVTNQPITITVGQPVDGNSLEIYHIPEDDDLTTPSPQPIENFTVDSNKISFEAPSFSTYFIGYKVDPDVSINAANDITVNFENEKKNGSTATYDIVLNATDPNAVINRFTSSQWAFNLGAAQNEGLSYTIEPSDFVTMTQNGDLYELSMDGSTYSDATGPKVKIGTVTITGSGEYNFKVDVDKDIKVHTTTTADNIVKEFTDANGLTFTGTDTSTGKGYNNATGDNTPSQASGTLKPATKDLTVKAAFPNAIDNKDAKYQDMKVTVSGGDLKTPIEITLGEGATTPENVTAVWNDTDKAYTVTIKDTLTENTVYKVELTGAGYRKTSYSVNMGTSNKQLNFWNNVKDVADVIEVGNNNSKTTKNFLAGDIVADNTINLYDLSAVVSYFGTTNDVTENSQYAKYDLNRDGKIDSKDIAYVLVSWGE